MQPNVSVTINAIDKTKEAFASLRSSLTEATSNVDKLKPAFERLAITGGIAFTAISVAAYKSVQAFAEVERAQRQLEHAVIDVSGGTKDQVEQIQKLTLAMENKVGVDSDSIKAGVAQLSTFGLSTRSVIALTKSLTDLTINQDGVNASAQDYIGNANIMAKALNGEFAMLTKMGIRFTEAQQEMIKHGSETQKVATIQQGFAQNLRETTDTVGGVDVATARLRVQFGNLSENIGQALAPAFGKIASALADMLTNINKFVEQNPNFVRIVLIGGGAIAALATSVGSLGLAFLAIRGTLGIVGAALGSFGFGVQASMAALGPYIVILGAAAVAFSLIQDKIQQVNAVYDDMQKVVDDASDSFQRARSGVTSYDTDIKNLNTTLVSAQKELSDLAEKAAKTGREISDAIKDSQVRQQGFRQDKANLIVDQEKKITDLEKKETEARQKVADESYSLQKETKKKLNSDISREDQSHTISQINLKKTEAQTNLDTLTKQLAKERTALQNANGLKTTLSKEYAEAQRFNSLTEFEQKLEKVDKEAKLDKLQLQRKLINLGIEAAAVKKQQDEIKARILETQAAIQVAEKQATQERISAAFAEAKAIITTEEIKAEIKGQNTSKYATARNSLLQQEKEALKSLNASPANLDSINDKATKTVVSQVGTTGGLSASQQYGFFGPSAESFKKLFDFVSSAIPFASGGVVTRPTLGLVGEAGPEAIIPLSQLSTLGGGGITINIGTVIGQREYALQMGDYIIKELKNNTRL